MSPSPTTGRNSIMRRATAGRVIQPQIHQRQDHRRIDAGNGREEGEEEDDKSGISGKASAKVTVVGRAAALWR
ncbi:hypothetical protein NEMBOFW57_005186 [Staphylotrichum longicolle]|uniref:Uncharacterized protein n=1 Tax=Staphylotrichum longicolle TaxID=669026 RepID=A0AAD4HY97_9PEZI|nr:hypothetical protein NEMBOFW57_005186 [Staphylotrichum longicolle]